MKTTLNASPRHYTRREALLLVAGAIPAAASFSPNAFAQARSAAAKNPAKAEAAMTPLAAVNISGRQRSLVLRAARCYAQLGLGINPQASSTVLRASMADFDQAMVSLRAYAGGGALVRSLDEVALQWREFTPLLREAPSVTIMAQKNAALEKIVSACSTVHDIVVSIEKTSTARLVSRAGRQRFLSQRAAQLFMYREWGVTRGDYKDIDQLCIEYKAVKRELAAAAREALKRELDLAESQWIFFEDAMRAQQKGKADDIARRNVSTTSERLLEMFDGITNQYIRSAA